MTPDELQALLQMRIDVLSVEIITTMKGHADTAEEKFDRLAIADMLMGAKMELQLLARFIGVQITSDVPIARDAFYPSSEVYEDYLNMKGDCECQLQQHAKTIRRIIS